MHRCDGVLNTGVMVNQYIQKAGGREDGKRERRGEKETLTHIAF
jgi:hypothetical protein